MPVISLPRVAAGRGRWSCNLGEPGVEVLLPRHVLVPFLLLQFGDARVKFLLHVCGAVRPLLPLIIDAGVDMLEPIQIRAAGMEPAALKRDFGRHLCFYGGVDLQQVLRLGTPETVADEVKRLIDILGEGGGYILGPGHTYIQMDAPVENILAMYGTAAEYRTSWMSASADTGCGR